MSEEQNKQPLGLIHLIKGDGKGKTTSSIGIAVRAIGRGLKVRIIQFFKRDTGEYEPLKKLGADYIQFTPLHPYFTDYKKEQMEDLKKELLEFWKESTKNLRDFDVLIIDEMASVLKSNFLKDELLLEFLNSKPENLEIVLTGRTFPKKIIEKADYVSEISLEKHPFYKGIGARKGIEF